MSLTRANDFHISLESVTNVIKETGNGGQKGVIKRDGRGRESETNENSRRIDIRIDSPMVQDEKVTELLTGKE